MPRLLMEFGSKAPDVWFSRYADPDPHLRVRLRLSSPEAFGEAVERTAVWADELRCEGLIQRVQWDTDTPETGRYRAGAALEAAERCFAADSAAAIAQLVLPIPDNHKPAVTAASMVNIATTFLDFSPGRPSLAHDELPQRRGHRLLPRRPRPGRTPCRNGHRPDGRRAP
ncbi:thiopeptide-type bacteriocin biosynthesis protein [Streptomyces sp. 1222.5]|uniref:thiopeptide-type bacteriocin biosynthesis protein n=1 Tax=Streptomyces sp. 1222.5 TaxID=1881026 RepID=UPI003EBD59A9